MILKRYIVTNQFVQSGRVFLKGTRGKVEDENYRYNNQNLIRVRPDDISEQYGDGGWNIDKIHPLEVYEVEI